MSWLQLTIETDSSHAERISDYLELFGVESISLEAVSDEPVFAQGITSDPVVWEHTRITALLHPDIDLDILLVCLRNQIGTEHILNHTITELANQDWIKHFRDSHGPIVFGNKLCICPSWCKPETHIEKVIMLDPGLAFGTGAHPTTSLCLNWLVTQKLKNKTILDYGCGSGILALSALALGAEGAYAVDIDPQALQSTRDNARKNQLETERLCITSPDKLGKVSVDIVIANILLNPLKDLASKFAGCLNQNGIVVLSGMMAHQVDACLESYNIYFNMSVPVYLDEWGCLVGVRKPE